MSSKIKVNALLRNKLPSFIERTFRQLNPGTEYMSNWHILAIAHALDRCHRGECKRLVITMPPRYLKSISVTVAFTAWQLGHDPACSIIAASYAQDLATWHHNDTRKVMESPWYRSCFPMTHIDPKKNTQSDFRTTKNGGRFATSVGGTLTGIGGNFIIIDDPHKTDEVESDVRRKNVIDWFRSSILTRLNDKNKDVIIIIQQRQHEYDLAGYLLETGDWEHLNLPAIATEDQLIPIDNNLIHCRREGQVLHPNRESQELLKELERSMGSYAFAAQYQQSPAPIGGGFIQWEWFHRFRNMPARYPGDMVVQSWDTAHTITETSDYSACLTFLCRGNVYYLVHIYRAKLLYPDLKKMLIAQANRFKPDLVIIEGSNSGRDLREDVFASTRMNVKYSRPKGDKVSRMAIGTATIEAGRLLIPEEDQWLPEFQKEIVNFPYGKHDDQVDALSQFLRWSTARDFRFYTKAS